MGALDDNGIYVYDENDRPSPLHTLLNLGQASVSATVGDIMGHALIKPVANDAERNAYEQAMRSAGYAPTPATPLYVDVATSGIIYRHRGAGWEQIHAPGVETYVPTNSDAGWTFLNRIFLKNGMATARIRTRRLGPAWSNSSAQFWGALPSRFRPPETLFQPVYVHLRQDVYRSALFVINENGSGALQSATIGTNNWINATITWPTAG